MSHDIHSEIQDELGKLGPDAQRSVLILLPVRNGTFVRLTPSRRRRLSLLPDRGKPAPPAGR